MVCGWPHFGINFVVRRWLHFYIFPVSLENFKVFFLYCCQWTVLIVLLGGSVGSLNDLLP